jgi:hypothetical protein
MASARLFLERQATGQPPRGDQGLNTVSLMDRHYRCVRDDVVCVFEIEFRYRPMPQVAETTAD